MNDSVTNPQLDVKTILDRAEAVETTVSHDRKDPEHLHIILIIGKGNERWFKDHGKHIPYEGDDRIVVTTSQRSSRVPSQITTKVKAL